jgi:hypothetical protein
MLERCNAPAYGRPWRRSRSRRESWSGYAVALGVELEAQLLCVDGSGLWQLAHAEVIDDQSGTVATDSSSKRLVRSVDCAFPDWLVLLEVLTQSDLEPGVQPTGPIDGRMKVIDPLMSTGPSARVQVVRWTDSEVCVRVPRSVLVGAMVYLRTAKKTLVGEVRQCEPVDDENEIRVRVKEVY